MGSDAGDLMLGPGPLERRLQFHDLAARSCMYVVSNAWTDGWMT
jgi:hypothetical protein